VSAVARTVEVLRGALSWGAGCEMVWGLFRAGAGRATTARPCFSRPSLRLVLVLAIGSSGASYSVHGRWVRKSRLVGEIGRNDFWQYWSRGRPSYTAGRCSRRCKRQCLHHRRKRGHGDRHRNKASLYVGGYLDVNRQPSVAVDRLSRSRPESALFRRLTGDW